VDEKPAASSLTNDGSALRCVVERMPPPAPARSSAPITVLLVEDDQEEAEVLERALVERGFSVVRAQDGIDAVSCLYASRPDVALVDLRMPRMNGLELIEQMREDRSLASLRVFAMSGAPQLLAHARELGVNGVLEKPLQIDALTDVLRGARRVAGLG
jgi:CheY-like chemotaxis protein